MPVGLRDVRDIVAGTLRDVEAIFTSPAVMRELLDDLRNAERILGRKLRDEAAKYGDIDTRFSGAQALAMQMPVAQAISYVQDRIRGRTTKQAEAAIGAGLARTVTVMEGLEQRFTGIATPVRLKQAAQMSTAKANARGMWARDFPTSVDRYGTKMLGEFEEIIRAGFVAGSSMDDIIAALTGHGGPTGKVSMAAKVTPAGVLRVRESDIPEGLFVRHKYWAERLVRTEMLRAYNGARQAGLEEMGSQFPDMKRKILATLDKRTAPDSVAVHGQIRGLKEPFQDGAGRVYMYPPARPNDRETVIPWRTHWEDSADNLSEWEKAAIGEDTSPETEKKLEAMLTGKPAPKAKAVKLSPSARRFHQELPDEFEFDGTWFRWPSTKFPGSFSMKKVTYGGKKGFEGAIGIAFENIGGNKYRKLALPVAPSKTKATPYTKKSPPTINQRIEADLRKSVTMDNFGYISVDGRSVGFAIKDHGVPVGEPIYMGYYGGTQVRSTHASGRFETQAEAAQAVMANINQQLAKAAQAIKAWDETAYFAAIDAGDLVTARHHVRGLLYENGVMPRDLYRTGYDNVERKTISAMPDARASHGWDGSVHIRIDTLMEGKSEHAHVRARHLKTQVHEELHGATKFDHAGFYQGHGAVIEEVSVEMAARLITHRAMPALLDKVDGSFGSYQHIIDQVAEQIAAAEMYDGRGMIATRAQIKERMAAAGVAMRSIKGAGSAIDSKDGILRLFLKHATLDPDVRKSAAIRIRKNVKKI